MNVPSPVRICVAEDEPKILHNIVKKIEASGSEYVVVGTAITGRDALESVRTHHPDVLFTDIVMPMMDGLSLIACVKEIRPDIHVVIVSGYDDFDYARQALRFGVDDFLLKPLRADPLRETLRKIRDSIWDEGSSSEYDTLFKAVHGNLLSSNASGPFSELKMYVALASIGNPLSSVQPSSYGDLEFFRERWTQLSSETESYNNEDYTSWWIIGDEAPNLRTVIVEADSDDSTPAARVFSPWMRIMESSCAPWPVKLCFRNEPVGIRDVNGTVLEIRRALDERTEIGRTQMIDTGASERSRPFQVLTVDPDLGLLVSLELGDTERFTVHLHTTFTDWLRECPLQSVFMKRLEHLVDFIRSGCPFVDDAAVRTIAEKAAAAVVRAATPETLAEVLASVYDGFIARAPRKLTPVRIVELVESYLIRRYAEKIDLGVLSGKFGFSSAYLSRVFREIRGIPPIQYLTDLRIRAAVELIAESPALEVKDISFKVGFEDQHYFSRVFKKRTGVTPTEMMDKFPYTRIVC